MNTDTHMSGSTVKNHISLIMVFEYSAIRKTTYRSLSSPSVTTTEHPATERSESMSESVRETRRMNQQKSKNQKNDRAPLSSEIPEWLQEFRENLVDEVPEHRDSHASSSHGVSVEPTRSEDLVKQC